MHTVVLLKPMLEAQLYYIYSSYPLEATSVEAAAHCALQTAPPRKPSTSRPSLVLVPQLFQPQDVLPTARSEPKKELRSNSARSNSARENSSRLELKLVQQNSAKREVPPSARRSSLRTSSLEALDNSGRKEAGVTAEHTETVAVTSGRGKQKTNKIGLPQPKQLPAFHHAGHDTPSLRANESGLNLVREEPMLSTPPPLAHPPAVHVGELPNILVSGARSLRRQNSAPPGALAPAEVVGSTTVRRLSAPQVSGRADSHTTEVDGAPCRSPSQRKTSQSGPRETGTKGTDTGVGPSRRMIPGHVASLRRLSNPHGQNSLRRLSDPHDRNVLVLSKSDQRMPRECSGPGVAQHRQARLARPAVHI